MSLPPRIPGLTLLRRIGAGATADVFAARRDLDGWRCAVKVLRVPEPADRAQISREAAVLSSMRLPYLVQLHDVVGLADGRLALVLDLVEGGSLTQLLDQRGHLTPPEVTAILGPLFATLDQLHRRGVLHGDVSTGNILLTSEGEPRLSDLGAARLIGDSPGEVCATLGFVAPEVVEGGRVTASADVHAAGAVGWHLLTGRVVPPWPARTPLREAAPGTPEDLATLLEECVSADPAVRPSAADAASRLRGRPMRFEVPSGPDLSDRLTLRIRGSRTADPSDERVGRHRDTHRSRVRRRLLAAPMTLLVLAGGVLGANRVLGGGGEEPAQAPVTTGRLVVTSNLGQQPAVPPEHPVDRTQSGPTKSASTHAVAPIGSRPRPDQDPVATLARLADARAAALMAGDDRALERVHSRGSAALTADLRLLSRLRDSGVSYRHLRYRVLAATRVDSRSDRAVVRARIDTRPFTVVDSRGVTHRRAAVSGAPMRFTLAAGDDGSWRIRSMEEV